MRRTLACVVALVLVAAFAAAAEKVTLVSAVYSPGEDSTVYSYLLEVDEGRSVELDDGFALTGLAPVVRVGDPVYWHTREVEYLGNGCEVRWRCDTEPPSNVRIFATFDVVVDGKAGVDFEEDYVQWTFDDGGTPSQGQVVGPVPIGGWIPTDATGTVTGIVYYDADQDGVRDSDELLLEGVDIAVYNSAGTQVATATTDQYGAFLVSDLAPGTYLVKIVFPDDEVRYIVVTTGNAGGEAVQLEGNDTAYVEFGLYLDTCLIVQDIKDGKITGEGKSPGYWHHQVVIAILCLAKQLGVDVDLHGMGGRCTCDCDRDSDRGCDRSGDDDCCDRDRSGRGHDRDCDRSKGGDDDDGCRDDRSGRDRDCHKSKDDKDCDRSKHGDRERGCDRSRDDDGCDRDRSGHGRREHDRDCDRSSGGDRDRCSDDRSGHDRNCGRSGDDDCCDRDRSGRGHDRDCDRSSGGDRDRCCDDRSGHDRNCDRSGDDDCCDRDRSGHGGSCPPPSICPPREDVLNILALVEQIWIYIPFQFTDGPNGEPVGLQGLMEAERILFGDRTLCEEHGSGNDDCGCVCHRRAGMCWKAQLARQLLAAEMNWVTERRSSLGRLQWWLLWYAEWAYNNPDAAKATEAGRCLPGALDALNNLSGS